MINYSAEWAPVLELEMKRWSSKGCAQLIAELDELQAYEVEFDAKQYQVEVELLENTAEYIHVIVAVDDGTLPASIKPMCDGFIRKKGRASVL